MKADLDDVLDGMKQKVGSSSSYWVAADGDKFRADFASWVDSTKKNLDSTLQEAASITKQNLGAIQQATESERLLPYFEPGNLLVPKLGNLIPNSMSHLTSGEEGALYYGTAGYLFSHYGVGHRIMLPGTSDAPWPVVPRMDKPPAPEITELGKGWTNRGGLLVPSGSSVDPNMRLPSTDNLGAGWKTGVDSGLRADPVNVPKWAGYGSKGLFAVGAGLTLYSSWDSAWQNDQALHPNWSTGDRIADAAGQTLVIGGASVAGGWAGGWAGAEGGAALGAAIGSIFPGPGTVIGGVVGGIIGGIGGGFVGGQLGQAVGEGLWDLGKTTVEDFSGAAHDVGQGLSDAGDAVSQGLSDAGSAISHGMGDIGSAIGSIL